MRSRIYIFAAVVAAVLLVFWAVWRARGRSGTSVSTPVATEPTAAASVGGAGDDTAQTTVYAHNLRLRGGPSFDVYVRWIRGEMLRKRADRIPSLDDQESYDFVIDKGVIYVDIDDLDRLLNTAMAKVAPLKNMAVSGEGSEMKLTGTLHKLLVPLPVELQATVSPTPDGRIHLHVTKISVLKVPVKGLLGGLKLNIKDIIGATPAAGVQVSGDDLYLDTTALLPPPHIRGKVTSIAIQPPKVMVIFGNAPNDEAELAQWHNFLRLRDGTVSFGKLTMRDTDLTLIDASNDAWFDLDLANYRKQLVQGYSHVTPEGGLEMFMPDVGQKMPGGAVPLETLKDKSRPLPATPAKK